MDLFSFQHMKLMHNLQTLNKSKRRNGEGKKQLKGNVEDEDNRKTLAYKFIALLSPLIFLSTASLLSFET